MRCRAHTCVQPHIATDQRGGQAQDCGKVRWRCIQVHCPALCPVLSLISRSIVCSNHSRIYLCICDLKYQRMLAFQFLNELMEFVKTPAKRACTSSSSAGGADGKVDGGSRVEHASRTHFFVMCRSLVSLQPTSRPSLWRR